MASVAKDPRGKSPFWYACYTDALGRRLKKSTGLTAKSKALEMARTLQKASDEARRGVLTEARTRELLSEVLQSVGGENLTVFTVEEWLDHFVGQKKKSRSLATGKRHTQTAREFLEHLGPKARLNIAAVSPKDIADFRDHRQSLGLAPATLNQDIKMLAAAFNAALRQGHVSVNPALALEPVKDKPKRKHVFTPEQVAALLKTAKGDWRGLIMTAFYTGQRLLDCANLRWRNVDLVSEIPTISFSVQKTGAEIVTVVHPALGDHLLSLRAPRTDDEYIFPTLAGRSIGGPLSKQFGELMEAAHIERGSLRKRTTQGSRSVSALSFHSLRHSFSSILANKGIAQELRMAMVGHSSREMHQKYTHHELEQFRAAIAVLPRL